MPRPESPPPPTPRSAAPGQSPPPAPPVRRRHPAPRCLHPRLRVHQVLPTEMPMAQPSASRHRPHAWRRGRRCPLQPRVASPLPSPATGRSAGPCWGRSRLRLGAPPCQWRSALCGRCAQRSFGQIGLRLAPPRQRHAGRSDRRRRCRKRPPRGLREPPKRPKRCTARPCPRHPAAADLPSRPSGPTLCLRLAGNLCQSRILRWYRIQSSVGYPRPCLQSPRRSVIPLWCRIQSSVQKKCPRPSYLQPSR
mmetsp:Transcript_12573/g.37718  ORF Transcript_12573/g.37718 Transcript_12573/m.37718 type:complete len:250 (+) Transcript_12573:151-900(+)